MTRIQILLLIIIAIPNQGMVNEVTPQPISIDNLEILDGGRYEDLTFIVNGYMLINSTDPVIFDNVTLIVETY